MADSVQLGLRGKQHLKNGVQVMIDPRHCCEPFALEAYIYDQGQWSRPHAAVLVQAHVLMLAW